MGYRKRTGKNNKIYLYIERKAGNLLFPQRVTTFGGILIISETIVEGMELIRQHNHDYKIQSKIVRRSFTLHEGGNIL